MSKKTLIIGCGDTGKRVINLLEKLKEGIFVTSHQKSSQIELEKLGISVIPADLDNKDDLQNLETTGANIFYFAPPPSSGVEDVRMANFIGTLNKKSPPKRIVYISTTGVYGNCRGLWISENADIKPGNDRSKRRLHAESLIQAFCKNNSCEFVILRVAGIYCLEKLPLNRIKNGMNILDPKIAPSSNRIHADDLANCCVKAMFSGPSNEFFNIADGNPSSISDYFVQIAKTFGLPKPKSISWEKAEKEMSPAMLSYLRESKKIKIEKTLNQLNIKLKYPTLKEGLNSCLEIHNAKN